MLQDFNHLEVTDLACARGEKTIFAGLDFSIRSTEVVHLQGRNGSGKTSLLRILCGFALPVAGSVHWNGADIHENKSDFCRDVGYIGHRRGVCEDLTPLENVQFANALKAQKSVAQCRDALARVGLNHVADTPTRLLSAGQNQRTALARLLISGAILWVLDEPFTSLDPEGRVVIETLIGEHSSDGGISIIAAHEPMSLAAATVTPLLLDTL